MYMYVIMYYISTGYYNNVVVLKIVCPPTCFSLKIVLMLIYFDNALYLTEHLTAAQLHVSTALYTKAIRAAVINSFKVLDLQTSVWKQLVNS